MSPLPDAASGCFAECATGYCREGRETGISQKTCLCYVLQIASGIGSNLCGNVAIPRIMGSRDHQSDSGFFIPEQKSSEIEKEMRPCCLRCRDVQVSMNINKSRGKHEIHKN